MTGLLVEPARPAVPAGFLLARLPVRLASAGGLGKAESDRWQRLHRECGWLYQRLDGRLRRQLAPVAVYLELATLAVCLRFLQAGQGGKARASLETSLWSGEVRRELLAWDDGGRTASSFPLFCHRLAPGIDLARLYRHQGLQGLEMGLRCGYLQALAGRRLHPAVACWCWRVIDQRNLLATAKALAASPRRPPLLAAGGRVPRKRLLRLLTAGDREALLLLFPGHPGRESGLRDLEAGLLAWLTRALTRRARSGQEAVALILAHLWRLHALDRPERLAGEEL